MSKLEGESTFKRLRNRYRMVVMNDDTYEEVVTFKLTRLSVYVMLSSIFVILVGLTVALIVFTPLRYYIPGQVTQQSDREMRTVKMGIDSVNRQVEYSEKYLDNIRRVLKGDVAIPLDTTLLEVPKDELSED